MDTIAKYMAVLIVGIVVGFMVGMAVGHRSEKEYTVTTTDTIPYYLPVPVDSYITHYKVEKLPAVRDTITDSLIYKDTVVYDSVNVVVPITQKKYTDSTYTAWVSGYKPQLDSISVYHKATVTTIRKANTSTTDVFLEGGYNYIEKQSAPFVGASLKLKNGLLFGGSVGLYDKNVYYGVKVGLKLNRNE